MKRILKALVVLTVMVTVIATFAMSAQATELKTGIGIVTTSSGLRLRAKPNTDAEILAVAHYSDNVVIIRQVGEWYLVNYNLNIGYMHADYLQVKDRENIDLGYGSIDPSLCNMRSLPTTESDLVAQITSGETVYIFGFNCGWYKVKYNGMIGYIRSDLVTLLEKPYINSGVAATIFDNSNNSNSTSSSDSTGTSSSSDNDTSSDSYSESDNSNSTDNNSTTYSGGIGEQAAAYAQKFVGYPYVYGGNGPSSFDCSGFVKYVYAQFGYNINRTATAQMSNGYSVSKSELRPGDLVFFYNGGGIGHVGMYIGNNQFIHAANSRSGVIITSLSSSWYQERYAGARRIAD